MSKRVRTAIDKAIDYIMANCRKDGSWGPSGSRAFRITATSLAMACLPDSEKARFNRGLSFLSDTLKNPDTPPMTRYFGWPLWALTDVKEREFFQDRLVAMQNPDGGWGHTTSKHAKKCQRPQMANSSLLPTFISVYGLSRAFRDDDDKARRATEKAVKWVLSLKKKGSPVIGDPSSTAYPISSTALALTILEVSESHSVSNQYKAASYAYLLETIKKGQALNNESLPLAGRNLDTPYILFTASWLLFALCHAPRPDFIKYMALLIKYLLSLQDESSGAVHRASGDASSDIFIVAQFTLALLKSREYLTSPAFVDDIIFKTEYGEMPMGKRPSDHENPVVLHISDIHWGANPTDWNNEGCFDSTLSTLNRDIQENYEKVGIPKPNIIVVSGDITDKGRPEGYKPASAFINSLAGRLDIKDRENRIIIIPGNHDLSRPLSELSYQKYLEHDDAHLKQNPMYNYRFTPFKLFYEDFYRDRRFSLSGEQMYQIYNLADPFRLLVIAFNSAAGTDHTPENKDRGMVYLETIERALAEIEKLRLPENIVRIAVWHHALLTQANNDPSFETRVISRLRRKGIRIIFHGHLHRPLTEHYANLDIRASQFIKFGAGSLSVLAPDRPAEWPRHYQVVIFNNKEKRGKAFARHLIGSEWTAAPVFPSEAPTFEFHT